MREGLLGPSRLRVREPRLHHHAAAAPGVDLEALDRRLPCGGLLGRVRARLRLARLQVALSSKKLIDKKRWD